MNIKRNSRTLVLRLLVGLPALVLVLSGCAGDSDEADGDTPKTDPNAEVEPMYVLGVVDPATKTSFIKFTPSLGTDGKSDESKTLETVAAGALYGPEMWGEFFVADGATGAITKYTVTDEGTVTEDSSVSFGAFGVNAFSYPVIQFASETKAYLWDNLTLKAFVWDPSTMTIVKDMDLSDMFDNEVNGVTYSILRERNSTLLGNKIYTGFHYSNFVDDIVPNSGVLVINTETDEFSVIKHPTCPGFYNSLAGPDGYLYYASTPHAGSTYKAGMPGQAVPCLARLDPKTGQWDDTYTIDLMQVAGGKAAGGLIQSEGSFAYMKVLNDELIPEGTDTAVPLNLSMANAWELYRFDVTAPAETLTRVEAPPSGSSLIAISTDGHRYMTDIDFVNGKTTLLDVSKNPPSPAFAGDGVITMALRTK